MADRQQNCVLLVLVLLFCIICVTSVAAAQLNINTIKKAQRPQQHNHRQHNHHQHQHHKKHQHRLNNQLSLVKSFHPDDEVEVFGGDAERQNPHMHKHISATSTAATRRNSNTTHLRRLSARDYYNKVVQRRLYARRNNEWDYHTYNIMTNTFGAPPKAITSSSTSSSGSTNGKGYDNTQDVEFITSSTNNHPEWSKPRPGYEYVPTTMPQTTQSPLPLPTTTVISATTRGYAMTTVPPPLVPARRGYATTKPSIDSPNSTDDSFESNTISRSYPSDPKEMERRHICVQQRTVTTPVKTTEIYTRPIWKHISTPCLPPAHANQMCTRVQLVHEQAFRDVIRHKSAQQVTYDCCIGWMRETPNADTCMKPVCSSRCQNGGTCSGPDTCSCPAGYTGTHCETEINECKEEKPCDQTCINTIGSYYCRCRKGFELQADQQSCKKIDLHSDDAFEARDLENDIETADEVAARIQKIERSLANERVQTHELQKSLQATYSMVDTLKIRLNTLEKQQMDLNRLQTNLYATETRTNKLEGMLNLLMKCRNGPNANCP